ncbi:MAG TPA: SIMPL domain-containing protein [Casimicrobiaceae bacterium]|nr:SIMPL domain-containing protein [Casimicrobiaceae bacterium]
MKTLFAAIAVAAIAGVLAAPSQAQQANAPVTQPVINVTASATSALPNDRMLAWLRVEIDNSDPNVAANEVNTRMGKALARAKAVKGIEVSTTAYSSYQISERNQPMKWRVSQTLQLESSDFSALSSLMSKIQAEDGLVLSGMNFSVSTAARRAAEDALTQQAIKAWQARAQSAAQGFGAPSWRPGHVTIQTGDAIRPQPMMRAAAGAMAAAAPVATEAGTSDITVTVSGEAILESARR